MIYNKPNQEEIFNKIVKCINSSSTSDHIETVINMIHQANVLHPTFKAVYYYRLYFIIRDKLSEKNIIYTSEITYQ